MKLYSRRMQIKQNFRDEKSERFGFGLRASYSRSAGRMLVLSLLTTLSTIVLWLIGYHAENKGLHLRYQANSIKTRRVISYLTLAENVLRHSPLILKRTVLSTVLNHLARTYQRIWCWFISADLWGSLSAEARFFELEAPHPTNHPRLTGF